MEKVVNSAVASPWRYERKFFMYELTEPKIRAIIGLHPAVFREIFTFRMINNIYFDTEDLQFYHDNMQGCSDRMKVRIRWYGDLYGDIRSPILELKIKQGAVGRKESYSLPPFVFKKGSVPSLHDFISSSDIPDVIKAKLACLKPTIVNRYGRTYFLSACQRFRVTLDTHLRYIDPCSIFQTPIMDDGAKVVELKYSDREDEAAPQIGSVFPFIVTRSSKYVMGVQRIKG